MTQPNDDLLWTAYRYSAGELSGPEAEAFELLLADDQAAREALATAVELTETVCAIERTSLITAAATPASTSRRAWSQPSVGWVAVVAAASIALMFVGQSFLGDGFGPQDVPPGVAPGPIAKIEPMDADTQDADSRLLLAMLDRSQADGEAIHDDASSSFVAGVIGDDHQELLGPDLEPMFDLSGLEGSGSDGAGVEDANATPDWLLAAVAESKS